MNIFIPLKSEYSPWWVVSWNSAYKYYLPNANILFKTDASFRLNSEYYFHEMITQNAPLKNDYYVVKKNEHYEEMIAKLENRKYTKSFENWLFEVYYVND